MRGAVLLEAVLGSVLLGLAVAALFGVSVAAFRTDLNLEPSESVVNAVEGLSEALANYVEPTDLEATSTMAPGGSWRLPDDPCGRALEAGCSHVATRFFPEDFRRRFPGATLTYTVTQASPQSPLDVEFTAAW